MSLRFDLYVERQGWAHRVDPRLKLLFVLLGVVSAALFSNLFFLLTALVAVQALILSTGTPRDRLAWVWKAMLPVNVLIPPLWTFFYPEGAVAFEFWRLKFTPLALVRGLSVVARLDTIAFICFLWLFTTDQRAIVRSLVKLGLPFEWGLVLAISLRYIPTLYGLYTMVAEAQQARALDLTRANFLRRLEAQLPILVAMIISALRMADQLARALEARAFGLAKGRAGARRTFLYDLHFTRRDSVLCGVLLLGFCGLLILRAMGWFTHPLYLP